MIGRMLGAAQLKAATYEEVEHDQGAMVQALLVRDHCHHSYHRRAALG